ncbi:hypothetical protein GH741_08675 [Aquibacillus halophilus]|uniref:DUF4878 domain-containing protein n=1 Tax=Aquibacillus halophilus TaxID=930132 RepID=A0A6A8DG50_9BACI|nr:hypothetical protein [Aquibacillus halophilus]MRH42761.1 hypothetical protein [Aquibacillus halophilus]
MYRKKGIVIFIVIAIAIITCTVFIAMLFTPGKQAKNIVDDFYQYEQNGLFANSWDLFHAEMKNKFNKGHYLQDRPHVFMNHFGVNSFTYELSDVDKIENWKMANEMEPIEIVYKVIVIQTYKGKYGNFNLIQNVYATKVEGEWKILWDYKK